MLENNNKDRRKNCSESEEEITHTLSNLNVKCDSDSCQSGDCKNERCQNKSCHNGNGQYQNGGYQNGNGENGDGYHSDVEDFDVRDMKVRKKTRMEVNDVCYINGGYHKSIKFYHFVYIRRKICSVTLIIIVKCGCLNTPLFTSSRIKTRIYMSM